MQDGLPSRRHYPEHWPKLHTPSQINSRAYCNVQPDRFEKQQLHVVPPWWNPPFVRINQSLDVGLRTSGARVDRLCPRSDVEAFLGVGPDRRDRVSPGLIVRKRGQRETLVVWISHSSDKVTRGKNRPTRPVPDRAIRTEVAHTEQGKTRRNRTQLPLCKSTSPL